MFSIRWKLTLSYVILSITTAAAVGAIAFFLIKGYVDKRAEDALQNPRAFAAATLEKSRLFFVFPGQFNHLADRLETNFADLEAERDSLEAFAENAQHELRTPVAALSNILDNAVKHTSQSGCVKLECHREGDKIAIVISDRGPGIDASDLPHVFERFYRAGTSKDEGSGLGLALADSIVRLHGCWREAFSRSFSRSLTKSAIRYYIQCEDIVMNFAGLKRALNAFGTASEGRGVSAALF